MQVSTVVSPHITFDILLFASFFLFFIFFFFIFIEAGWGWTLEESCEAGNVRPNNPSVSGAPS